MDNIEMIPTYELFPHLQNPRKELGDLEELVDSIKANGVLQNLTVVPRDGGGYTVIIGNRRLAAARRAGLTELPCAVVFMTEEEQFKTMMVENMQRSDLTTIEQADGFQYMLDLGESMDTITRTTGFSRSTINRRLKLRELDRDKLKSAEGRGGTIHDYMELMKIEDPEDRNTVLDAIGTSNFNNMLQNTLGRQERLKQRDKVVSIVSRFAKKFPESKKSERYSSSKWEQCKSYHYKDAEKVEPPADAETRTYYYIDDGFCCYLYTKPEKQKAKKRPAVVSEYEAWYKNRKAEIDTTLARHKKLREDFLFGLSEGTLKEKKNQQTVVTFLIQCISGWCVESTSSHYGIDNYIGEMLGFKKPRYRCSASELDDIRKKFADEPMRMAIVEILAMFRDYTTSCEYVTRDVPYKYSSKWRLNEFNFTGTDSWFVKKLNVLYGFMAELGYEASSEELSVLNGSFFEHINDDAPALPELQKGAYAIMDENGHWSEGTEDE